MRGQADPQLSMLSLQTPEQMVPVDHPLRRVKQLADEALKDLSPFDHSTFSKNRERIMEHDAYIVGGLMSVEGG